MNNFSAKLRFIEQYLDHFKPALSKTQFSSLRSLIYGMFYDYKRLNLAAVSRKTHINYQKLQHFFTDSNWNINQINDLRVQIIQNQPTTRATANGVFAIDDTGCPKPHALKTEGAQIQHCGSLGRE